MAPIESEIRRFLAEASPEVLCIRGKWGVGKTFAWKKFLKTAVGESAVALNTYSYVSLFGVSSVREAKRAIFENQVMLSLAESTSASRIARGMSSLQGVTKRGLHGALQMTPFFRNAADELANAAFAIVHDQIICLDDLERLGQGLRVKDVLGLVSFLKEEKNCKIVLLLNRQQMTDEEQKDFGEQLEKVVDVELEFAPSPAECASIGLSEDFPLREDVERIIIALGIANIRTIKRIERMAMQALKLIEGLHANVLKQAVATVAIGTWAKQQPNDAPPLEYIKRFNSFSAAWDEQIEGADPQTKIWNNILDNAGYGSTDDFDLPLLAGVDAGFFDADAVRKAAAKIDRDHARSGKGSAFSQAWRLYHDSLHANDGVVLDAMFEAVKREPDAIDPMNMSASIQLFRQMGRDDQASEMIKMYIDAHSGDRNFFDLTHYPGDVRDEELRQAFANKYDSFEDKRDPAEVMLECARLSGWNRDDAELLGKLTSGDFVKVFESLEGEDTSTIIKMALRMGIASTTEGKTVADNAAEALREIAARSPMNRLRVQGYGVQLEPEQPPPVVEL